MSLPNGPAQNFNAASPEVPQPVNDFTTITSVINVPVGTFAPTDVVANVTVRLSIPNHTWDADLDIF